MSFPVLVADDNSDAGGTLAMVLEMLGHTVVRVEDGIAALNAACEMRPRAIFLDIGMPGISGWEVCRQIRALLGVRSRTSSQSLDTAPTRTGRFQSTPGSMITARSR